MIITASAPPDDWEPDTSFEDETDWFPSGWPCYIAYVCEYTRITDDYLHMFDGDGKNLSKSGAKSRKESRNHVSKNMTKDRDVASFQIPGSK